MSDNAAQKVSKPSGLFHNKNITNNDWWEIALPPAIISFITFLFYYPSLNYPFQFDDSASITKFFHLREYSLSQLFMGHARWISYWISSLNYWFDKLNPFYYRLVSVSTHICTGILFYYLLISLFSKLKQNSFFYTNTLAISSIATILFMLHPVQTQTVSYVIQSRLEGVAGLFIIAICLVFVKATESTKIKQYGLTALLFILGFLATGAKEIVIITPLLLLLIDWFFIAQGDIEKLKERTVLHISFFSVIILLYMWFLKPIYFAKIASLQLEARNNIGNVLTENHTDQIKPLHFFISQFKVILHYITIFLWPFNISVEYDWKLVKSFFSVDCLIPLFILLTICFYIVRRLKKNNTDPFAFWALWFVVAILPRSSIIPSSELINDYKVYAASFGIVVILSYILIKLSHFIIKQLSLPSTTINQPQQKYALSIVLLLFLGCTTYQRNRVWRSTEEFWKNIIAISPKKARAYNNFAVALSEKKDFNNAIPLYKKAISLDQNYPDPWNNLAVAYSITNKKDLAIQTLQHALKISPYHPEGYNNLASLYLDKKEYDLAETAARVSISLRPYYGKAWFNLGQIKLAKKKPKEALHCFKHSCMKADFDNPSGFQAYATSAFNLKKWDEAAFAYTKLLSLIPNSLDTMLKVANCRFLNKEYNTAANYYHKILAKNKKQPNVWYNLGECYVSMNEHRKALESFTTATKFGMSFPTINLRIAACLEKLGRHREAKPVLEQFLRKPNLPNDQKTIAQNALSQINSALAGPRKA